MMEKKKWGSDKPDLEAVSVLVTGNKEQARFLSTRKAETNPPIK